MDRNVSIAKDVDGKEIVVIHGTIFKGRQNIDWDDVEHYLKQYIGELYQVIETGDCVYIGSDFPDEFSGSENTVSLKGTLAKAKANLSQGIPELICTAVNRRYDENKKKKHTYDAKYGWYRFDSRFALPVYSSKGNVERYNVFRAVLLVRHDADGKKYLYDVIKIKKETGTPHCL